MALLIDIQSLHHGDAEHLPLSASHLVRMQGSLSHYWIDACSTNANPQGLAFLIH